MDVESLFEYVPFVDHLGIELREAGEGYAAADLPLEREHSSNPSNLVAHGGVTYALADTVGGAAVVSAYERVTPTVDMRIDYLAPATGDLAAEAEVVRGGESVAVADVDVYAGDLDGERVAAARGVYKTGGGGERTPWTAGVSLDEIE